MAPSALITLSQVAKRFGDQPLFSEISLSVHERDRLGIIGPNGRGKSTLLRILAGEEDLDGGTITRQRSLRVVHVTQSADFPPEQSALDIVTAAAHATAHSDAECLRLAHRALADMEFDDEAALAKTLSGGQQKRLQIACGLAQEPDLLLLDEPTNHLDIPAIMSLEKLLTDASFAWIAVSHDRWFLENAVQRIAEISPVFPGGVFTTEGSYRDHLARREDFLAAEASRRASLENKVRTEQAWLRRGAKARSTKAKGRSDRAYEMMEELSLVRARQREQSVNLSFEASERQTKKLVEFVSVSMQLGSRTLLKNFSFKLLAGQAVGVLGRNGSGKSTFIKLLAGELQPTSGTVKPAAFLSVAHFRQVDDTIDESVLLKELFSPDSDSVVYQGKSQHVSGWAKRFGFQYEQLFQTFCSLSGGEKARARLARIMLETPDVLILDEPTNDLDIPTLEMLEQSLSEFEGALVLVTHDRFMMNRLCTIFLGLDGNGETRVVADYAQWERELSSLQQSAADDSQSRTSRTKAASNRLSYKEQREYNSMETNIHAAEERIAAISNELNNPEVQRDAQRLHQLCSELDSTRREVERLYERWSELEQRVSK